MDTLILEVISESIRRQKIITGPQTKRYLKLAEQMGLLINRNNNKFPKLTIEYYPGTFPEFDTDDDLDLLTG